MLLNRGDKRVNPEAEDIERMLAKAYTQPYGGDDDDDDNVVQATFGYGGTRLKEKDPPKPPLDTTGEPLNEADIMSLLETLAASRLRIDSDVKGKGGSLEQQADRARTLEGHYDKLETKLKKKLREAREYEAYRLEEVGGRPYGMDTDEGDIAITKLVDEEVDQFHEEFRLLKEKVAERIRERLDKLTEDGLMASTDVRDKIYEDLVNNEVIEDWEPLEF